MNIPSKYRMWFYVGTVVVMVGSIIAGIATPDTFNAAVDAAVKVVGLLAAILAAVHVTKDETPPSGD